MNERLEKLEGLIGELNRWEDTMVEALEHGGNAHSFDDVVGFIMVNRVFFFSYPDCFIVMEKVNYPQFNVFHCFIAGGELEAILSHTPEMKKIARELDCKFLSMSGRRGWERPLAKRGWSHIATTMYLPAEEFDGQWQGRSTDYNGRATARN